MARFFAASFVSAGALVVGGCTSLSNFPQQSQFTPAEIVTRVECQLRNVVDQLGVRYPNFKVDWSVGIQLSLEIERSASGSLTPFQWTIPAADTLKLAAEAGRTEKANRKIEATDTFALANLDAIACPSVTEPQVAGSNGIFQEVADYIPAVYEGRLIGENPKFTFTTSFTVDRSAALTPSFGIVNLSGGVKLSGGRTDRHTMVATFQKNTKPVKKGGKTPLPTARSILDTLDAKAVEDALKRRDEQ